VPTNHLIPIALYEYKESKNNFLFLSSSLLKELASYLSNILTATSSLLSFLMALWTTANDPLDNVIPKKYCN